MRALGQFVVGLASAAGVSLLILFAFSLALLEGRTAVSGPAPLPEVSPTALPTETRPAQTPGQVQPRVTPSATPTVTITLTQTPSCPPAPDGWVIYTVQPGETLEMIATRAGVSANRVREVNCLPVNQVVAGMQIYLPNVAPTDTVPTLLPTAPPTATVGKCPQPFGWVFYTVRFGDTLYSLSRAFGVSVFQLKVSNCLNSDFLLAGQRLYVPNVPTIAPTATRTPEPTNTPEPEPEEPTATNTSAPVITDTPVPDPTATDTEVPATATPTAEQPTAPPSTNVPAPTQTSAPIEATATP